VEFIETFSYVIIYKQGKENILIDMLSRRYAFLSRLECVNELYVNAGDADQPNTKRNHANNPLEVPIGQSQELGKKSLKKH
jgi:hypothetical protein